MGKELKSCDYCNESYEEEKLLKLPKELDAEGRGRYCRACYPKIYQEVKKFWWNQK